MAVRSDTDRGGNLSLISRCVIRRLQRDTEREGNMERFVQTVVIIDLMQHNVQCVVL